MHLLFFLNERDTDGESRGGGLQRDTRIGHHLLSLFPVMAFYRTGETDKLHPSCTMWLSRGLGPNGRGAAGGSPEFLFLGHSNVS